MVSSCCRSTVGTRSYSAHGLKVSRSLVLKVGRVGDLARRPRTLIRRVVDQGSSPLALVVGVLLHGRLPFAAPGDFLTLRVRHRRRDPVAILLVIPVLGLFGFGVGNADGLILEPVIRLGGLLVHNLKRRILVPIIRLRRLGVGDLGLVNPVGGLLILGVIDLLLRVDWRAEVLMEGAVLDSIAINQDLEGLVGLDDQSVEAGGLGGASRGRSVEVLLLILAGLGVLVTEDEVNLEMLGTSTAQ